MTDKNPDALGQTSLTKRSRKGGWRGSQASLDALAAHRAKGFFGSGAHRKCPHCERPAVRGAKVCMWHGGWKALHNQGRLPVRYRINRQLRNLEEAGQIPQELVTHPAWIAVRAKGSRGAYVAEEMWKAWSEGGVAWVRTLRKLKDAGLV